AIEMGCSEFDFLRGDEPYKSKWASDYRQTRHVLVYPETARARVVRFGRSAFNYARRGITGLTGRKSRRVESVEE
ncbi:MAG: hypothetical protein KGN84_07245, partial [Acidobacteriota bacterium]|nr:hypothetical protein [Acidobacteriota bacterium]